MNRLMQASVLPVRLTVKVRHADFALTSPSGPTGIPRPFPDLSSL